MATVDSLDIQISAEVNKANASIELLSKKLDRLSTSLSGVNSRGLATLGAGVNKLANAMSNFSANTKTADFSRLGKNLEKLSTIPTGNMQAVASTLKPLADGVSILSNTNFDNKNLQSMINSLTRLSNSNVSNLSNVDFTNIGNSLKNLTNSLAGAEKVQQSTISMTNAIAKLADSGVNIPIVSSSLSQLGTSLKGFMATMSGAPAVTAQATAFTQAIAQLSGAGTKVATTASNLGTLANELKAFMKTMSNAPAVNDSTIRMTEALANLASQGNKTSSATQGLQAVFSGTENIGNKFNNSIKKLSSSMKGLGDSIKKTASKMKSFKMELLSAFGVVGGLYGTIRGIKKSIDISSDLVEVQNVVDTAFGDMAYKVEDFAKTSIEQFGMSELALKQYASRFQAMGTAMGINSGLISSANKNLEKITGGYINASGAMADVSLNLTKLTADLASFYNMEQDMVAQDLESIFTGQTRPLRTYGLDLTEATLKEWALKQGLDADMKAMSQAEKTMLRYQYVLANTGAAQGDFARTANTWANQIRILKQQFEQLASIIGTAFINMLKPVVQALNKAMAKVLEFAQTVVNALGKIFGWKLETNIKGIAGDFSGIEDGIGDLAGGIEDATEASKKFNKQLQGFDKLNNLTTSDVGKDLENLATGLGNAGDIGDIVPGEGLFDKYESDIDTLYKLGKYLGETLKNFLDNIPWDAIKKKAREIGEGIADLVNGFIDVDGLGYSIGKSLIEAVNTGFELLNAFVHRLHWESIGHFIADTLNGFFENIDWGLIRDTFVTGFKGLADAINQFITDFHWDNISNTISNAISIIAETVYTFFSTIKWDELGKNLGEQLRKTIEKIDWETVGSAIGSVLRSAFDFVKSFLKEQDFTSVKNAISDLLKGFFKEVNTKDLALVLTGVIATAVAKISFKAIMAKLKYKFFTNMLAKALGTGGTAGAETGAGLLGGLKTAWSSLGGLGGILTTDLSTIMGAGTATEIGVTLGVGIISALGGALIGGITGKFIDNNLLAPLAKALGDEELAAQYKNFKWFGEGGFFDQLIPDFSSFENFKQDMKLFFDSFVQMATDFENHPVIAGLTNIIGGPIVWLITVITEAKGALDNFDVAGWFQTSVAPWFTKEKWEELGQKALDGLQTKWGEIKEKWSDTWDSISEKVNIILSNIKTAITNALSWITDKVNSIKTALGGISASVKSVTSGKMGSVIGSMISKGYKTASYSIPRYATGGFPEDGWFRASHGEIMGQFDNGQSVVANNNQITDGIEQAAYRGFMRALQSAGTGNSSVNVILEGDAAQFFKYTKEEYNKEANRKGVTSRDPVFA